MFFGFRTARKLSLIIKYTFCCCLPTAYHRVHYSQGTHNAPKLARVITVDWKAPRTRYKTYFYAIRSIER